MDNGHSRLNVCTCSYAEWVFDVTSSRSFHHDPVSFDGSILEIFQRSFVHLQGTLNAQREDTRSDEKFSVEVLLFEFIFSFAN